MAAEQEEARDAHERAECHDQSFYSHVILLNGAASIRFKVRGVAGGRRGLAGRFLSRGAADAEKVSGTFCRNGPKGCFAQKVPDTFSASSRGVDCDNVVGATRREIQNDFARLGERHEGACVDEEAAA